MIVENSSAPIFKYLYDSKMNDEISVFKKEINDISILKDFNDFLIIYHRMPEDEILKLFNTKISNEVKFLCVKAIIESSFEKSTDEEIVDYFGDLVYNLIKELCLEYEYPEDRTNKYANLYRNVYKNDISYFLSN